MEKQNVNESWGRDAMCRSLFAWVLVLAAASVLLTSCSYAAEAATERGADEPAAAPIVEAVPAVEAAPAADLPSVLQALDWLGHASFRINGPSTLYIDPVNLGSTTVMADIVLITHGHLDHLSQLDLQLISTPETIIVANSGVAGRLSDMQLPGEVRVMAPGEQMTIGEVDIEAVPAYSDNNIHPRENGGLGFIVTVDGERIYHAGGTNAIPEMADIRCDVALLPLYSMEDAVQMAQIIRPGVAVLMHFGKSESSARIFTEQFRALYDGEAVVMPLVND